MRHIIIPVILLCCALSGQAQSRMLSFDECVALALQENITIKTARNNMQGAELQKKEAFTGYLPSMSLGATALGANEHLIKMKMQFPPEIPIPARDIELAKSGVAANVSVMLPVYTGGRIYNANKLAKVGVEVEKLKLKTDENEVRTTVAHYYWQIVALKDKIRTVDAVLTQLEAIRSDAIAAVEAGLTTRNDLLQVELRKNEMESTAIEINNNTEVLQMLLAQYIGLEDSCAFDTPTINSDYVAPAPQALLVDPERALTATPEYALLNKGIEAAHIQKRLTLGESLPQVAIGGGYFFNNLLDRSRNSLIGMITVSVPINWKTGYSMHRSKLAIDNASMALSDGSERLVIGMRKAYNDLDVAFKNIDIASKSIAQARENLRMHEDFYQAGTATMSDLLNAQTLLMQSCDRFSEAVATYEIKKVEYLGATGR